MPRGKSYESKFKTKVVLESLREENTLSEIASKYEITPKLLSNWRSQFLSSCSNVFEKHPSEKKVKELEKDLEVKESQYIQQIGEMSVELNWMKKKAKELGLDD